MAKATPTRGRPAPKKQRAKKPATSPKKRTSKPKSPRTAFGLRENALAGDEEAVALVLETAILALEANELMPEPVRAVLLQRLRAVSPDPFGAPLFERPAGLPIAATIEEEQWEIARVVASLHERGMRIKEAIYAAAQMFLWTEVANTGGAKHLERVGEFYVETIEGGTWRTKPPPDQSIARVDTAWRKYRAKLTPKTRKPRRA
jgi:hypothetical protein